MMHDRFFRAGWCRFGFDPVLADWVRHVLPAAHRAVASPKNRKWLRCDGTWFVGVNALPNGPDGAVGGGPELAGAAVDFIRGALGISDLRLDRAQVSTVYPGYPKPTEGEAPTAYRYRLRRDAAHVDGLRAEGPARRRHLNEYHAFILGVPLVAVTADTAPLVIWEGSHEVVRESFRDFFAGTPPASWDDLDITEVYHQTRRRIFERCPRVEITCRPGESYLLHRLALHGIAPWRGDAAALPEGRMVIYFRPDSGNPESWLTAR